MSFYDILILVIKDPQPIASMSDYLIIYIKNYKGSVLRFITTDRGELRPCLG